jgi:hypothetical protein
LLDFDFALAGAVRPGTARGLDRCAVSPWFGMSFGRKSHIDAEAPSTPERQDSIAPPAIRSGRALFPFSVIIGARPEMPSWFASSGSARFRIS